MIAVATAPRAADRSFGEPHTDERAGYRVSVEVSVEVERSGRSRVIVVVDVEAFVTFDDDFSSHD